MRLTDDELREVFARADEIERPSRGLGALIGSIITALVLR